MSHAAPPQGEGRGPHRPSRLLHTMLRVGDLQRSLRFYVDLLGMRLLRRVDYPAGRFTLAFVGFADESEASVLELTHNWDQTHYAPGSGFGHVALAVADLARCCADLARAGVQIPRPPGPMSHLPADALATIEVFAFAVDPDGYRVELIQRH
ncbi:MAG TPA: lactoylglutathione lyase [Roseateles sp.]